MLKKLSLLQLKILRDVYTQNWSKNFVTHQLLSSFIERFEKYPEWTEKVHFLSDKSENLSSDGSFVMINENKIYFDTFEAFPHFKMMKSLSCLDFEKEPKMFVNMSDKFRPFLKYFRQCHNLEETYDNCRRLVVLKSDKNNYEKFIKE